MAKILGELAEDVAIDFRAGLRSVHGEMDLVGRRYWRNEIECEKAQNYKNSASHTFSSEGRQTSPTTRCMCGSGVFGQRRPVSFRNPQLYRERTSANKRINRFISQVSIDEHASDRRKPSGKQVEGSFALRTRRARRVR